MHTKMLNAKVYCDFWHLSFSSY